MIDATAIAEFKFRDSADNTTFFEYFEKTLHYTSESENLTPFKAIKSQLLYLAGVVGFTIFAYFEAVGLANGTEEIATSRRVRSFQRVIGFLGVEGVLLVGGLFTALLLYTVWKRFKNPPIMVKLLPPNN